MEVKLERKLIDMIPDGPGVHATIVIALSDTPADSRDTDNRRYITMAQADELGLFHMPFDSEEFKTRFFTDGNSIVVEMPSEGDEITVELASPAQLLRAIDSYAVICEGFYIRTLDGIEYFDADAKEWIFYPMESKPYGTAVRMEDPFYVAISLEQLRKGAKDELVYLERGDYVHAPDASFVSGTITVVKPAN